MTQTRLWPVWKQPLLREEDRDDDPSYDETRPRKKQKNEAERRTALLFEEAAGTRARLFVVSSSDACSVSQVAARVEATAQETAKARLWLCGFFAIATLKPARCPICCTRLPHADITLAVGRRRGRQNRLPNRKAPRRSGLV